MKKLLLKYGPLAAMFVTVSWFSWEHLVSPAEWTETTAGKVAKLDRNSLLPAVPPPSPRNPFAPAVKPVPEPETTAVSEAAGVAAPPTKTETATAAPDFQKLAAAYHLDATFVTGQRSSALINQQLCFEGDSLSAFEGGGGEQTRVSRIAADHVVLEVASADIELRYDGARVSNRLPAADSLDWRQRLRSWFGWLGPGALGRVDVPGAGNEMQIAVERLELTPPGE